MAGSRILNLGHIQKLSGVSKASGYRYTISILENLGADVSHTGLQGRMLYIGYGSKGFVKGIQDIDCRGEAQLHFIFIV